MRNLETELIGLAEIMEMEAKIAPSSGETVLPL